ncbi:MAG: ribosome small subunit-dependent GTPase A [Xanthomonadaceae bacterium]|nr:ribosome small subunit-dependent GTPase A [Xanthomonadaceae bacterium]
MKKKFDDLSNRERNRFISKKSKKVNNTTRTLHIPIEETNATVLEIYPKFIKVRIDNTGQTPLCTYRRAALWQSRDLDQRDRSPLCCGDRVKTKVFGTKDGLVEGVAKRRNQLSRVAPGRDGGLEHVIAANLDLMVIVSSFSEPEFSPGLVDRFLIASLKSGITPLLCINKVDLKKSEVKPWAIYESLGIQCITVSAKKHLGLEELKALLKSKAVVFCGHSGVGKTSLLNQLVESYSGKTGSVNKSTGKGKHTTSSSQLLTIPDGGAWIDTPGVRAFSFSGITEITLKNYFPEFEKLPCSNTNCLHDGVDPLCNATELFRYDSYQRILESLREEAR